MSLEEFQDLPVDILTPSKFLHLKMKIFEDFFSHLKMKHNDIKKGFLRLRAILNQLVGLRFKSNRNPDFYKNLSRLVGILLITAINIRIRAFMYKPFRINGMTLIQKSENNIIWHKFCYRSWPDPRGIKRNTCWRSCHTWSCCCCDAWQCSRLSKLLVLPTTTTSERFQMW